MLITVRAVHPKDTRRFETIYHVTDSGALSRLLWYLQTDDHVEEINILHDFHSPGKTGYQGYSKVKSNG